MTKRTTIPTEGTRIVFTGDIAFSHHFHEGWKGAGCLTEEVKNYLRDADHVVANIEGPMTDRAIEGGRVFNHSSDPRAGEFICGCNICVWGLSNNHILDCGSSGVTDTLQCAQGNGCIATGAGTDAETATRPVILGDAVKVGILAVSNSWPWLKTQDGTFGVFTWDRETLLRKRIRELRVKVDWVVLYVHGGDEFCDLALPHIRQKYRQLLDMGANIIVGHHPHVVQNYEILGKDKAIFYSLGNFIFDTDNQRDFTHTECGMLLGIDFRKDSFEFSGFPLKNNRETHIIEKGGMPAVFRQFDDREYDLIWPYVARRFYQVDLKLRLKLSKRLSSASKPVFLAHEVLLAFREEKYRRIYTGCAISYLGRWRRFPLKDVLRYLEENHA